MKNIESILVKHKQLIRYLIYSIIVTIIDIVLVWLLMKFLNMSLVYANTIGVIVGFVIHYFLSSKSVFDTEYGIAGFIVYLITFILGLALANFLIYSSYHYIFFMFDENINFILSKGVSIILPFFILYSIRKLTYYFMDKYRCKKGDRKY